MRASIGWLNCIPGTYDPMWGEPQSACNSISDQTPCIALNGPYPGQTYCPSVMPGYPGLRAHFGMGATAVFPYVTPGFESGICPAPDGTLLPCPDVSSVDVIDRMPADQKPKSGIPTWLPWAAGGVMLLFAVMAIARNR